MNNILAFIVFILFLVFAVATMICGYKRSTGEKEFKEDTGQRFMQYPERCIKCQGDCNICEEIN